MYGTMERQKISNDINLFEPSACIIAKTVVKNSHRVEITITKEPKKGEKANRFINIGV